MRDHTGEAPVAYARAWRLAARDRPGNNRNPVNTSVAVPLLELDQVSRRLAGREIVHALSFGVARGEVLGLLGVNGAGKSTTLRLIAGVLTPDAGAVRLDGECLHEAPHRHARRIGYLPERVPLHAELGVVEYLDFCARLRGLGTATARAAVAREIERCELGEVRRRLTGQLSKGYQQRVGLAQALLHEPDLIVLDEPASGLDPLQAVRLRDLIRDLGTRHAVIVSTHQLAEAQAVCDRVAILHQGTLRHCGPCTNGEAGLERLFLAIVAGSTGLAA